MHCPVCKDSTLVMAERQGIEIDYCPGCRGVWLDRGELDKLIERSAGANSPAPSQQPYRGDAGRSHSDSRHGYHKKPSSWLSDIFD